LVAVAPDNFEKDYFDRESHALGAWTGHTQATIGLLGDRFTRAQLSDAIDEVRTKASVSGKSEELNDALLALTRANYRLNLPPGADIVHMPEMDGFEVVQAIRERERTMGGHLPVIALTSRSRKEDRERCLAAGMDDFLTKPIRPAELLAVIDRLAPAPGVSRPVQPAAGEPVSLLV
jgi:CheY-like chemotaxis protein